MSKDPSPKEARQGCLGCLGAILMVAVLGTTCAYLMERFPVEEDPPSAAAEPQPEPEPEAPTRQNPQFLANLLCRQLVEDAAQYGFRWTDGLLGLKFEAVDALGGETVDFIGDEVKLANGFGAWQRHRYACTVWPGDGTARLNLIEPGRWP